MKVIHLMAEGSAVGGIENMMVDYANYSCNENIFMFAWGGGFAADKLTKTGCEVVIFEGKKIGSIKLVKDISKKILNIYPDYIIVHHASPQLRLIGIIISRKIPVVVYHHCNAVNQNTFSGIKRVIVHIINTLSVKTALKNVAISKSVRDSVHNLFGLSTKKMVVIYNGVDITRFHNQYRAFDSKLKLIYVGRLIKVKGVQVILKALRYLKEYDYDFTIVGDGDYRSTLENISKEYGLQDKVRFLGNRNDIPDLLDKNDIFISVPLCEEGFGNAVVEAMASGMICVCSESGGIKEIIKNNYNGFLIMKDAFNELEILLKKIFNANDRNTFMLISENAVRRAKIFNIYNYSRKLDSVIKSKY